MERKIDRLTCPNCGRKWVFTKAGAEDFALMAMISVPDWFKEATGAERFEQAQIRRNMPKEAQWEQGIESQAQFAGALDLMEKCCTEPRVYPNDEVLPKTGNANIHRGDVDLCCVNCVPKAIVAFTAEEAGLKANFPDKADNGEPGPDSAKVLNKPARDGGAQGE